MTKRNLLPVIVISGKIGWKPAVELELHKRYQFQEPYWGGFPEISYRVDVAVQFRMGFLIVGADWCARNGDIKHGADVQWFNGYAGIRRRERVCGATWVVVMLSDVWF